MGDEDPKDLIAHFIAASRLAIDPDVPGFSKGFMNGSHIDGLVRECYLDAHRRYIESRPAYDSL